MTVAAILVGVTGCLLPTDRSPDITVSFLVAPGRVVQGDSVTLVAEVTDRTGAKVPALVSVRFGTSDVAVAIVRDQLLIATGPGAATISAWAPQFAQASADSFEPGSCN